LRDAALKTIPGKDARELPALVERSVQGLGQELGSSKMTAAGLGKGLRDTLH
jgi:hypothetical protein